MSKNKKGGKKPVATNDWDDILAEMVTPPPSAPAELNAEKSVEAETAHEVGC